MENEFYRHYKDRVVPALRERHQYKNVHQIPRVAKVVVNTCVGSQPDVKQALDEAKAELALITGQQPSPTRSKKSIANFKLRKDEIIGAKVTLRGDRMYEFLDRLVSIAIPRIRDFRGISTRSFDGRGNYSLGVKEQIIFPEIQYDQIDQIRGMDITISTSAHDDKHGRALLEAFNFPFRK
jgi:large subunit ribosomal protein L5